MGSEDLLTKFDEMAKMIGEERAKMKAEVEAYNAEKQRMKAVQVSDDDIIQLNVGGQKFTTKRSTLCQVEGSLLASMFSGRWEDGLARDQDGCIFFDFNPQYFDFILDYLRAKKIATPDKPASFPKVSADRANNFKNLVEYLGLDDEMVPPEVLPNEIFTTCSSGITLAEGGKVAVHDYTSTHKYVLGKSVYQAGIVHFKMKLESFQNKNWLFVGIMKGDVPLQNNNSYGWSGSYGWALGSRGQVYKNGSYTHDNALKNLSNQGDTVELVLDCDAAKLSLHLPTGKQFNVEIPKNQTWKLHVNLFGVNDKICIVDQWLTNNQTI